jgi:hypothetical protein
MQGQAGGRTFLTDIDAQFREMFRPPVMPQRRKKMTAAAGPRTMSAGRTAADRPRGTRSPKEPWAGPVPVCPARSIHRDRGAIRDGSFHLVWYWDTPAGTSRRGPAKHQQSHVSDAEVMSVVGYTRASRDHLRPRGAERRTDRRRCVRIVTDTLCGSATTARPRRTRLRADRGHRHGLDRLGGSLSAVRAPSWPSARTYSWPPAP